MSPPRPEFCGQSAEYPGGGSKAAHNGDSALAPVFRHLQNGNARVQFLQRFMAHTTPLPQLGFNARQALTHLALKSVHHAIPNMPSKSVSTSLSMDGGSFASGQ